MVRVRGLGFIVQCLVKYFFNCISLLAMEMRVNFSGNPLLKRLPGFKSPAVRRIPKRRGPVDHPIHVTSLYFDMTVDKQFAGRVRPTRSAHRPGIVEVK